MWEMDHKESWAPKKQCSELWCWRRLMRVPWTARGWNQSVLKEISPEYSLEGWMLKLKFQYFGHLKWRTDSLEKTSMLGKTEAKRRGRQDDMVRWHHQLDGHEFEQASGVSLACLQSMGLQRVRHNWATELNWTDGDRKYTGTPDYLLTFSINLKLLWQIKSINFIKSMEQCTLLQACYIRLAKKRHSFFP